jgi:hypothetical protein
MSETRAETRAETLAGGKVRITLAVPMLEHGRPVESFTLRPPTIHEQIVHGDPVTWVADGASHLRVVDRQMLFRLFGVLVEGADADFLGRSTDLRAGYLIEDALLGFFLIARTKPAPKSDASSASA